MAGAMIGPSADSMNGTLGSGAVYPHTNSGPSLSPAQQNAAFAPIDRPLVIVAAAGSGKTSVLCHRILHMVAQGVEPSSILAVTFTRRAGQDLLQRVRTLAQLSGLGGDHLAACERVRVGTFHSFCLAVLRKFAEEAGLARNFTVYTPKMQRDLLLGLLHEYYVGMGMIQQRRQGRPFGQELHSSVALVGSLPPEQRAQFQAEAARLLRKISRLQADAGAESSQGLLNDQTDGGMFERIYDHYKQRLREANGVDFNGFIRHTVKLCRSCPEVLQQLRNQSKYVLADEFQDTDTCQFELLRLLCAPAPGESGRLTVVGDDDQQIYTWRGAAGLRNFAAFDEVFPDANTALLEQNFRCSAAIVSAARMVIARNARRRAKSIRTLAPFGAAVTVSECRNEACEATEVAEAIQELVAAQGLALGEIAVLYRLQRVGLDVMQGLRARGIGCRFKGSGSGAGSDEGLGFSTGAGGSAFDDVLAVLSLVVNESNDAACSQLLYTCSQHVGSRDGAVSACLNLLNLEKGMPLLAAVRTVRAHALGVMPSPELQKFPAGQSLDATSDTMGAMLAVLRIVSSSKQEAQHLGCKDLLLNVLKQIAPYHENDPLDEVLPSQRPGRSKTGGTKEKDGRGSFAFAGIKALLKEAELFEEAEAQLRLTPTRTNAAASNYDVSEKSSQGLATSSVTPPPSNQSESPLRREGLSARPDPLPRHPSESFPRHPADSLPRYPAELLPRHPPVPNPGRDGSGDASTSGREQDAFAYGGVGIGGERTPLRGPGVIRSEGWVTPPPGGGMGRLEGSRSVGGGQGGTPQGSQTGNSTKKGGPSSTCGGSYADLMAKRGRRSTPAQLSNASRTASSLPRPSFNLTPGNTPPRADVSTVQMTSDPRGNWETHIRSQNLTPGMMASRAESSACERSSLLETTPGMQLSGEASGAAGNADDAPRGGFSFSVTPCDNSRSSTLFRAPQASQAAAHPKTPNPQAQTLTRLTDSQQTPTNRRPGGLASAIGRPGSSKTAQLQKFVDRVLLRSEEQELGEGERTGNGNECARKGEEEEREDAVTLTTIHQAKGLEWTAVILVRAIEGVLPLADHSAYVATKESRTLEVRDQGRVPPQPSNAQPGGGSSVTQPDNVVAVGAARGEASEEESEALEEERRLLYVALTRAKKFFMVTHVMTDGGQQRSPSRFLFDIPKGLTRRTQRYDCTPAIATTRSGGSQTASQQRPIGSDDAELPSMETSQGWRGASQSAAAQPRKAKGRGRERGKRSRTKGGGEEKENAGGETKRKRKGGRKGEANGGVAGLEGDENLGKTLADDDSIPLGTKSKRRPLRVIED